MMPPTTTDREVPVPRSSRDAPSGGRSSNSAETREKLIDAARSCLLTEGIAGASARAIARHGDLNQALVFYHYGSVEGLLAATARQGARPIGRRSTPTSSAPSRTWPNWSRSVGRSTPSSSTTAAPRCWPSSSPARSPPPS